MLPRLGRSPPRGGYPLPRALIALALAAGCHGAGRGPAPDVSTAPRPIAVPSRQPSIPVPPPLPPFDNRCSTDDDCAYSEWVPGHCCKACAHGATRAWDQAMATACAGRPRETFEACFRCQGSFGGHGPCRAGHCAPPVFPSAP